jgi:hypothetical protein
LSLSRQIKCCTCECHTSTKGLTFYCSFSPTPNLAAGTRRTLDPGSTLMLWLYTRRWHVKRGESVQSVKAHSAYIRGVAWAPNGHTVATCDPGSACRNRRRFVFAFTLMQPEIVSMCTDAAQTRPSSSGIPSRWPRRNCCSDTPAGESFAHSSAGCPDLVHLVASSPDIVASAGYDGLNSLLIQSSSSREAMTASSSFGAFLKGRLCSGSPVSTSFLCLRFAFCVYLSSGTY